MKTIIDIQKQLVMIFFVMVASSHDKYTITCYNFYSQLFELTMATDDDDAYGTLLKNEPVDDETILYSINSPVAFLGAESMDDDSSRDSGVVMSSSSLLALKNLSFESVTKQEQVNAVRIIFLYIFFLMWNIKYIINIEYGCNFN